MDVIKACRVCLATETQTQLFNLDEHIRSDFEDVLGFEMNLHNCLPKHICKPCKSHIQRYTEFKSRCCLTQLQLNRLTSGVQLTKDLMADFNKTFQPRNLAITKVLKLFIDTTNTYPDKNNSYGFSIENYTIGTLDKDIKNECITDSNEQCTYDYEYSLEHNDLSSFKSEETQNGLEHSNQTQITETEIDPAKSPESKARKRVSKKPIRKKSSLPKKLRKKSDEAFDKSEYNKASKIAEHDDKSTSKIKVDTKTNWQKRLTEQSLKKYNMQLRILTKEEQIEKVLARKESEKYKLSRLKCEVCYKPYSSDKAFANHVASHRPSPLRPAKCELCHLYLSRSTLRDHLRSHRTELVCLQCGEEVSTVQVKLHYDFHAGVKFECKECKKLFHHKSTYKSHLHARHADVACALCGDVFFGHQGAHVHVNKAHLEEARAQCAGCKHYFCSEEVLQRHLDACSKNVIPCGWCGVSAGAGVGAGGLAAHIADQHAARPPKELVCSECNSTFRVEAALVSHWRRVHQKSARQETVKSQKSRNNVVCEQCGAMLMSSCHLRTHMMKHTGEKPHQCGVCHKSFRLLTTFKSHMLVHSGEKPFRCGQCPNAYRQNSHLTLHMRTHTGEKPYACDVCHKAFACKGNRDAHARTVHEGLPPRRRGPRGR